MTAKSPPPISPASLDDKWYEAVRYAMSVRDGVPIRANPSIPAIDVWSNNRHAFMPLLLPGGGLTFETWDQRNEVLRRLLT